MAILAARVDPLEDVMDGEQPKRIIGRLAPLVAVPRKSVEHFVRLRSSKSQEELDRILQDYDDRTSPAKGERSASKTDASHSSGSQTAGSEPQAQRTQEYVINTITGAATEAQGRLHKYWRENGVALCSTTSRFFKVQKPKAERPAAAAGVFGELWRPDKRDELAGWRSTAATEDVEHLAASLRGLKYVTSAVTGIDKKHTEHTAKYLPPQKASPQGSPVATKAASPRRNERNLSQVPIGSIYRTDPWEIDAFLGREKHERAGTERVLAEQGELLEGRLKAKGKKTQMSLIAMKGDVGKKYREPRGTAQCMQAHMRTTPKSEYRAMYVTCKVDQE